MELTFRDRIRAVAGKNPYTWASQHGIQKPTMTSLMNAVRPQRKSLVMLEEKTGIPLEWWLSGALPPPNVNLQPHLELQETVVNSYDVPEHLKVEEHPSLPPIEVRRMQGKINVEALTAIIEGALKTAPNAAPHALAAHCAKIYAQAIEAGLITPDGLGPGRVDKAA